MDKVYWFWILLSLRNYFGKILTKNTKEEKSTKKRDKGVFVRRLCVGFTIR